MDAFNEAIFVLARDYGRWIYIVAAAVFFASGTLVQNRSMKRHRFSPPFTDTLIGLVGVLALFVAFAMQTAKLPLVMMAASCGFAVLGWIVAKLLVWTDRPGEGSSQERLTVVMAIVFGARIGFFRVVGFATIFLGLGLIGIFVWGAFAHDPTRFGDRAHIARLAIIFLTMPSLLSGALVLLSTLVQMASQHATHAYRNMMFASAVLLCVSQSVLIFGPLIFLRPEFEALGIVMPSNMSLFILGGGALTILLVAPYLMGFFAHIRLERTLRKTRRDIFDRAVKISQWKECDYKEEQVDALRDRVLREYVRLQDNFFLAYLGLELVRNFIAVGQGEQVARAQLVQVLIGEGGLAGLDEAKKTMRANSEALPKQMRTVLDTIDGNEWGDLIDASPVVRHFYEIMIILPTLISDGPELEYVSSDLLEEQEAPTHELGAARPAIAFTLLSSVLPQLWRLFGDEAVVWLRANWQLLVRIFNIA